MRGGGNVRVRPDGTELEIYSRGTRNDYDVAIDPYMNLFARGNTNDGGGFDIRLYHFVAGATYGYPSLFRNFADEVDAAARRLRHADPAPGMLYVQDPGLPAPFGDTLYSVDWGTNAIYRHPLTAEGRDVHGRSGSVPEPSAARPTWRSTARRGSTWRAGAAASSDTAASRSAISRASRIRHDAAARARPRRRHRRALVELVTSANLVHRRFAQHELLRRGAVARAHRAAREARARRRARCRRVSRRSSR